MTGEPLPSTRTCFGGAAVDSSLLFSLPCTASVEEGGVGDVFWVAVGSDDAGMPLVERAGLRNCVTGCDERGRFNVCTTGEVDGFASTVGPAVLSLCVGDALSRVMASALVVGAAAGGTGSFTPSAGGEDGASAMW